MKLLSGIDRFCSTPPMQNKTANIVLPRDPSYSAGTTKYIGTVEQARDAIDLAYQLPLSAVGFDFEFRYQGAPLLLRNGKEKTDARAVQPLLMAVTLVECTGHHLQDHNFVFDLTKPEVVQELQPLLDLPVTYVAHHAKAELFCLWQLGLVEPKALWDTHIAERALYLGLHHLDRSKYYDDVSQEIEASEQHKKADAIRYGLLSVAKRYSIKHRFETSKASLQQSFIDYSGGQFDEQQIHYAAEDAICAARVYFKQLQATALQGCLRHLLEIEMPWVITNASMEWKGVRIDHQLSKQILEACKPKLESIEEQLAELGLANPNSHHQKEVFFSELGLLPLFKKGTTYSFEKKRLRELREKHEAIRLLATYSDVTAIQKDALLHPGLVGSDGRVHPEHKQMEVVTGRQSTSSPNLMGLHGKLRPVVIPQEGYGIGEVDLAQVEVAITASVYGDTDLIKMYNSGDIYTTMAQRFYATELPTEHKACDPSTFKTYHKAKRDVMKQCTLGIIYGLTAHGLAVRLNIAKHRAQSLMDSFLAMFPTLVEMMARGPRYGAIRGYVSTSTGLSRHRKPDAVSNRSEQNWMVNMPVQGTAAALFKIAGNRLRQIYKQYDANLILALHDAFIFEAPLENIKAVSNLTGDVMTQVIREHFPELKPRVDINDDFPHCWNKDGDPDTVQKWLDAA